MTVRIHPTAIVEDGVTLGAGTSVWDNVHIRHGTQLGDECIVGEQDATSPTTCAIGNRVKINALRLHLQRRDDRRRRDDQRRHDLHQRPLSRGRRRPI